MNRRIFLSFSILIVSLALVACGPESAEDAAAIPTRTPRPTFTPTPVQVSVPVEQPATPTELPQTTASGDSQAEAAQPEAAPNGVQTPTSEPATPTSQPQDAKAVVTSPLVNLRSGPGTGYALAGSVERGAELSIVGKNPASDWWQVNFNGQMVWIASFLVDTTGPVDSVAVASNIPAPPPTATPQPVVVQPVVPAPTQAPPSAPVEPTPAPAPSFTIAKGNFVEPRNNSNQVVSFFGTLCNKDCYTTSGALGGYKMIVEGPNGRSEGSFDGFFQNGDPGLESQFIYNVKIEVPGAPPGNYRVYVADVGGNQVSEAWEYSSQGTIRTFLPRFVAP